MWNILKRFIRWLGDTWPPDPELGDRRINPKNGAPEIYCRAGEDIKVSRLVTGPIDNIKHDNEGKVFRYHRG